VADDDGLDQDFRDYLATSGKAIAGLVPIVGGVLAELVGQVVPRQRTERIISYLRELDLRLRELEIDASKVFEDPERVDLIEEGAFQAARATSDDRVSRIAGLVADGLAASEASIVRRKRLAALLREIDDDELLLLHTYGEADGGDARAAWERIDRPDTPHMKSSVEETDAAKLFDAGHDHLVRLGLLEKRYRTPRKGEERKFDARSGDFEHRVEISYLGRMLLRAVGLPSPIDAEGLEQT
jgi:hypothetical protein